MFLRESKQWCKDVSGLVHKNWQNSNFEAFNNQVIVYLVYPHSLSPEKFLQEILTKYLYH